MIRHVRRISINIRNMVRCFVVLLRLMRVAFGELNEFLTIGVIIPNFYTKTKYSSYA
jgi:hypothetical protein